MRSIRFYYNKSYEIIEMCIPYSVLLAASFRYGDLRNSLTNTTSLDIINFLFLILKFIIYILSILFNLLLLQLSLIV